MRQLISHRTLLFVVGISLFPHHYAYGQTTIRLDLRAGIIGPLSTSDSLELIRKKIGDKNIKQITYQQEGSSQKAFTLTLAPSQTVTLTESYYEITSQAFKTPENLGVGSSWREFRKAYPDAKMSWAADAFAIWSEKYKFRLYFPSPTNSPKSSDRVTAIHRNHGLVRLK